jgi:hypothetical protein
MVQLVSLNLRRPGKLRIRNYECFEITPAFQLVSYSSLFSHAALWITWLLHGHNVGY